MSDQMHSIYFVSMTCHADLAEHVSDVFPAWVREAQNGILVAFKATPQGKWGFSQLGVWNLTDESDPLQMQGQI